MEIKAQIIKPYTDQQRISFIKEYNRRLGYKIEERQDRLVALYYTEQELAEIERQNKINEIEKRIEELNNLSLSEIRQNNLENVKVINQIINGLEETKRALE